VAAELSPGPLVVVHTTGSPTTVEWIAQRGLDVIDAAASGRPSQVADGTLTLSRAAEAAGVDVATFMETLRTCSGQSYATDLVAAMGSAAALVEAAGPFIRKDVAVARAVAAEIGAPLGAIDGATAPLLRL
jgi:3-hydroxyisobutyrate dehydrogenase-like beta-hydroxyacid dehydrogenase